MFLVKVLLELFTVQKTFALVRLYSLTSPDGHLSITDSSFGPKNAKNHTFPTSIMWTPL